MRTVIIKVDSKEAEYIERLDYERGFTKDVLQRIIESHMDDPGVVNSETFKAYQKQGVELDAQFKMAVTELEQKYIPDTLNLIILLQNDGGKEMIAMLWAQQIMLGKKTYAEVPRLLKAKVKEILEDSGMGELAKEE